MFCWFMNHELPTPVKEQWYLLDLYEIDDKTQPATDEVTWTESNVIPDHTATNSSNSTVTTYHWYTETKTISKKVYPKLKKALVMTKHWKLIYDVDALSIVIMAEDINIT